MTREHGCACQGLSLLSLAFAPRDNAGAKADNGGSSAAVRREPLELKAAQMKYEPTRRRATAALGRTESKQHAI